MEVAMVGENAFPPGFSFLGSKLTSSIAQYCIAKSLNDLPCSV